METAYKMQRIEYENSAEFRVDMNVASLMRNLYAKAYAVGVDDSELSDLSEDEPQRGSNAPPAEPSNPDLQLSARRPFPHLSPVGAVRPPFPTSKVASPVSSHETFTSTAPAPRNLVPISHLDKSPPSPSFSDTKFRLQSAAVAPKRKAPNLKVQDQASAGSKRVGQKRADKRRRILRQRKIEEEGHIAGDAFRTKVLPSQPVVSDLEVEGLPIASGAWVGVDAEYWGARKRQRLEELEARGMRVIQYRKGQNVPVVDGERRIMVCFVGSPDDPGYDDAVEDATEAILAANREAGWKKKEKRHKHGDFPAVACGISFGKGQPEPMQLGGERQEMMKKLLAMDSFRRIASFQSAALRTWFPHCYEEAQRRKAQLLEFRPNLRLNFDNSVYLCTTINFGPSTWTHIHTDSKNDPSLPCAITSGGKYNWKLGGHLILWDFNVIFEFPPGTTILLSSAILRHSNIPVAKGETRISVTQYTAGSIHRWLEYGGRTEEEFEKADPEAYLKEMSERRAGRWKESLARYSTFEELRSSA